MGFLQRRHEEHSETRQIQEAVMSALRQFAGEKAPVVIYKPVIQINMANGGGAKVYVKQA